MNPIQYALYVTVTYAKSSSATLVQAIAEWTQAQKDQIFADIDTTKGEVVSARTDVADVKEEVVEAKSETVGEYDRDRESLQAIRRKIEELTVSKVFSI